MALQPHLTYLGAYFAEEHIKCVFSVSFYTLSGIKSVTLNQIYRDCMTRH